MNVSYVKVFRLNMRIWTMVTIFLVCSSWAEPIFIFSEFAWNIRIIDSIAFNFFYLPFVRFNLIVKRIFKSRSLKFCFRSLGLYSTADYCMVDVIFNEIIPLLRLSWMPSFHPTQTIDAKDQNKVIYCQMCSQYNFDFGQSVSLLQRGGLRTTILFVRHSDWIMNFIIWEAMLWCV